MKYNYNGEAKDIKFKVSDTLPVGSIVDFDGEEVPIGYVEVEPEDKIKVSPTEPENGEEVWIEASKNLFDKNAIIQTSLGDNHYMLRTSYNLNIGTYTFSNTSAFIPYLYVGSTNLGRITDGKKVFTVTEPVSIGLDVYNLTNINAFLESIQIEKGSTATPYEPYVANPSIKANINGAYETIYEKEKLDNVVDKVGTNFKVTAVPTTVWTYNTSVKWFSLPNSSGTHTYLVSGNVSYSSSAYYSNILLFIIQCGSTVKFKLLSGATANTFTNTGIDIYVKNGEANSALMCYGNLIQLS